MIRIRCKCCLGEARVEGRHEHAQVPKCPISTFIDFTATYPKFGPRAEKISLWDEETGMWSALVPQKPEKEPKPAQAAPPPPPPREKRRRPGGARAAAGGTA
jgi:hypothetical protein